MAFTIRNATVANDPQAAPDKVDFDILVQGINGEGVVSGCAVTAQATPDMTVAVAGGVVRIGGVSVDVFAGNVTIGGNTSGQPRFDLVVVSSTGLKSAAAGTAESNAKFPNVPASSVALAAVYVPNNPGSITSARIEDKRAVLPQIPDETYLDRGAIGATTTTLNYSVARTQRMVLTAATCPLAFTGWPPAGKVGQMELFVIHDNTTNSRAITYPAGARFPSATQPFMPTTTANAVSRLLVTTIDGGVTTYWDLVGNDYA